MSLPTSHPLIRNSLPLEGVVFVVLLLFVAVCAVLRNVNMLVVVSGTMLATLLLCWRLGRYTVRHVVVQRVLPNRMHVGQPAAIQWRAENRSRLPAAGLSVKDSVWQSLQRRHRQQQTGTVHFAKIPAGETGYTSYRVLFGQRGAYQIGPAVVSCQYPLPLCKSWFRTRQISEVHVAPQLGRLAVNWQQVLSRLASGMEFQSRSRGPQEEEFFGVRKWRAGDHLRKIHWRSTAKHRQPMIKQFDGLAGQDLTLVLDLFQDPAAPDATRSQCELILSFAATLVAHWAEARTGRLMVAIAGAVPVVSDSSNHADFVNAAMGQLALAEACTAPQTGQVIGDALSGMSTSSAALVLSSRPLPGDTDIPVFVRSRIRWLGCRDETFAGLFTVSNSDAWGPELVHASPAGRI